MRRIILGDLKRVLAKKSVGITFIIFLIVLTVRTLMGFYDEGIPFVAVKNMLQLQNITGILLGVVMFNAIYADDFRAMSYVTVIGRGISRTKYILAKLSDIIILSVIMYGVMCIVATLCLSVVCSFTHTLATVWFGAFVITIYKTVGFMALASMILFITNNIPLGTIVYVLLYFLAPSSELLLGFNENIRRLHLERLHYEGLGESAFTDILFGSYGAAAVKILFGLIIYFGGVLVVTNIIFDRRELEF